MKKKTGGKGNNICFGSCGVCRSTAWLAPLIIVILAWWVPGVTWAQIIITLAALAIGCGPLCPCRKSK